MPAEDPKQAYEALKNEIRYHNYRYYVLNDPVVSDFEYDQLTQKLTAIEAQHQDWITPDSPSQRAGAEPLSSFKKVTHPAPILSLAAVYDKQACWIGITGSPSWTIASPVRLHGGAQAGRPDRGPAL